MVRPITDTPGYRDPTGKTTAPTSAENQDAPQNPGGQDAQVSSPEAPEVGAGGLSVLQQDVPDPGSQASDLSPQDSSAYSTAQLGEIFSEALRNVKAEPEKEIPQNEWQYTSVLRAGNKGQTRTITQSELPVVDQLIVDRATQPKKVRTGKGEYTSVLGGLATGQQNETPVVESVLTDYQNNPGNFMVTQDNIVDRTSEASPEWSFGSFKGDALVIHHTAGRPSVEGTIQTFKERGFPAHYIIDREGQVHQVLGENQKGQHTRPSEIGNNISNSNAWGVEIIARNDEDVNAKQVEAAIGLSNYLNQKYGMPLSRVVGHGAINTHKEDTEGQTVVQALAKVSGRTSS